MADPVWSIRFVPGHPGKWNSKRVIGIWFHIAALVNVYGAVRIPTEVMVNGLDVWAMVRNAQNNQSTYGAESFPGMTDVISFRHAWMMIVGISGK